MHNAAIPSSDALRLATAILQDDPAIRAQAAEILHLLLERAGSQNLAPLKSCTLSIGTTPEASAGMRFLGTRACAATFLLFAAPSHVSAGHTGSEAYLFVLPVLFLALLSVLPALLLAFGGAWREPRHIDKFAYFIVIAFSALPPLGFAVWFGYRRTRLPRLAKRCAVQAWYGTLWLLGLLVLHSLGF